MIVETIHAAAPVAEQVIAVGENLSPMEIPGAGEKVDNGDEVQTTVARIIGGCLLIMLAGPIVNALVS